MALHIGMLGQFSGQVRRLVERLIVDLGETFDLQHLCCLKYLRQLVLGHVNLTAVHELDEDFQIGMFHVVENHNRMLCRILGQQFLKNK